jgi:hypothetical protein
LKYSVPAGDPPMQQGTRYGTTTHSRKVVQDSDAYAQWAGTTSGRRDKRGSPVEQQAIGMAWVPACQSVGARAAPCILNNAIKDISGTVGDFARLERWRRQQVTASCGSDPGASATPARRGKRASSIRCCGRRRKQDTRRVRPRLGGVPWPTGARLLAAAGSPLVAAGCSARHGVSW